MTLKEIKKAVNSALKERFPDMKIYGADTIEGYIRPSFFVYITQTFSESTKNAAHKVTAGNRNLNTNNMELDFQGENLNIPVCRFDVEFWDQIPRKENYDTMKELIFAQEVRN